MAIVTEVVASVADDSGEARLEYDYDDTQGTSDDLVLDELRVVNNMDRPVFINLRRAVNGQTWESITIEARGQWTKEIRGGPVQREGDLVSLGLVTR